MTKKPTRTARSKTKTATSSGGTRRSKPKLAGMDKPKAPSSVEPFSKGEEAGIPRNAKGQFRKGYKGGPGRPPGAKDRLSLSILQRMQERGSEVVEKALEAAIDKGDMTAVRLITERLLAKADSQPIQWKYCTAMETAEDIDKELTAVLHGVGEGKITPGQSKYLRELLEAKAEAIRAATMGDVRTAFEMDERVLVQIRANPQLFAAASRFVGLLGQFFLKQQHPVIDMARVIAAPDEEA